METKIRKIGNSTGVLLGKRILAQSGLAEEEVVNLTVLGDKIIIEKMKKKPREGWEEQLIGANAADDHEQFFEDNMESAFERNDWTW